MTTDKIESCRSRGAARFRSRRIRQLRVARPAHCPAQRSRDLAKYPGAPNTIPRRPHLFHCLRHRGDRSAHRAICRACAGESRTRAGRRVVSPCLCYVMAHCAAQQSGGSSNPTACRRSRACNSPEVSMIIMSAFRSSDWPPRFAPGCG